MINRFFKFWQRNWLSILLALIIALVIVGIFMTPIGGPALISLALGEILLITLGIGSFLTLILRVLAPIVLRQSDEHLSQTEVLLEKNFEPKEIKQSEPIVDLTNKKELNHRDNLQSTPSLILKKNKTPDEEKWLNFTIRLANCVIRDSNGQVIGIDFAARKALINQELTENGSRFPKYMQIINSGNVVMSMQADPSQPPFSSESVDPLKLQTNFSSEVQQALSSISIVQNIRSKNGVIQGRSLYGGIGDLHGRRDEAVISNLKLKFLDSIEVQKAEIKPTAAKLDNLAYSLADVSYLINMFMPNEDFLNRNAQQLNPSVREFYQARQSSQYSNFLRDEDSLKLAVSNTYHWSLNEREAYIIRTEANKTINVKGFDYTPEVVPLLAALYPQDYFYKHEFYSGILPLARKNCENVELFKSMLEQATHQIIQKMMNDIQNGVLPFQLSVPADASSEQIFLLWKKKIHISFKEFINDYPGIRWDSLIGIYELSVDELVDIDNSLEMIWENNKQELTNLIDTTHLVIEQENILIEDDISLQQSLLNKLTEDPLTFDQFESPIIAADARLYDTSSYGAIGRGNGLSPFSRLEISRKNYYEYIALKRFKESYIEGQPLSSESLSRLTTLCRDMLTGEIMSSPYIVIKKNGTCVICDQKNLPADHEVEIKREFSELKEVLVVMRNQLTRTVLPPKPVEDQFIKMIRYETLRSVYSNPHTLYPPQNYYDASTDRYGVRPVSNAYAANALDLLNTVANPYPSYGYQGTVTYTGG